MAHEIYINGVLVENPPEDYIYEPIASPEREEAIRDARGKLLKQTDWTQVPDAPVDKAAWATYRQALRDITKQSGFPLEVTWPTKPSA
jgi:hypothetical protein